MRSTDGTERDRVAFGELAAPVRRVRAHDRALVGGHVTRCQDGRRSIKARVTSIASLPFVKCTTTSGATLSGRGVNHCERGRSCRRGTKHHHESEAFHSLINARAVATISLQIRYLAPR